MQVSGIEIEDTFAEAFRMWGSRVLITARTARWAMTAATVMTGCATSVIGCGCEAGIEGVANDTPDGRPGVNVLVFTMGRDALAKELVKRIGQCVMTCPTTACYNALAGTETKLVGNQLRYFGDRYQSSKLLDGRRFWRIPVMDGEFVVEESYGIQAGVGGGNILILSADEAAGLEAAERAVEAMTGVPGVILPFPGGIVRSGSKVGSSYAFLNASTNTAYCPTLRGSSGSALPDGVNAVHEIVIDGLDLPAVEEATRAGIAAACAGGLASGVRRISAGNYGGKLGRYTIRLHDVLSA
jgi:formylmethanofuran--tetrahydromethanopterin N-formyltransferase